MKADLLLKTIIIGVVAALLGTVTGILGFKLGQQPPHPIVVQLQGPLAVVPR